MGGGTKWTPDTPKSPPRTLMSAAARSALGASGSSAGKEVDFCSLSQSIPFTVDADEALTQGTRVRLAVGSPPSVLVDNRRIGVVEGPAAMVMQGCLEAGYEMAGTVQKFDPSARSGIARVRGQRPGAT